MFPRGGGINGFFQGGVIVDFSRGRGNSGFSTGRVY